MKKSIMLLLLLGCLIGCAAPSYQIDPFPAARQKEQIIKPIVPYGSTYDHVINVLGEPRARKPFYRAIDADEEWVYILDKDLKSTITYDNQSPDFYVLRLLFGNKKVVGSLLLPIVAYSY